MTTDELKALLDEATPGPWRIVPDQEGEPAQCITADGFDMATAWGGYLRAEADARLIALAPDLAAALIKAEEALAESVEIVHKEYVRATLETVNAGPHHLLQKQMDAWRVRCMNAEKVSRAALSEIRALTGGRP